uniref:Saposin B-type domain-containing protein n=1 Tax=Caenorhabditis tropicalis TaxID=1561998 RepID=A0A1I7U4U6_9PELO
MKLLLLLLLALFAMTTAETDLCFVCSGFIKIPEDWEGAKELLGMGCNSFGNAAFACKGVLDAADLTESYPKMYPHILELKNIGCKYFCHV